MLNLTLGINMYNQNEQALYDEKHDMVIMSGDVYNCINIRIEGFIEALEYRDVNYHLGVSLIDKNDKLFKKFGFSEFSEDYPTETELYEISE